MKIPLMIRTRFGQPMPFLFIGIRAPKYRVRPMPICVLVDTGSPWAAITPYDAMILNIPSSALKGATEFPIAVLAGYKFRRLLLENVALRARDETGEVTTFDLPSITILDPTKKIPPEEFRQIPSVFGM